jgi:branched-chain amino acid transport system substrate-binding protein
MRLFGKFALVGAAIAVSTALAIPASFAEDSLYLPNLAYRTGPFAATGIPLMDGQRDYIAMLNARDGGLNGVKLNYDECETGYNTEKGVECYEKTKDKALVTQPWSTGITLQVLPKSNVDKIPILAPGYGFSPMAEGKIFQWAFNPPASYWDGASMILKYISGGNLDSLKGKKIVLLHLDAPYGKEPIPVLQALAKDYGFELKLYPVPAAEMQNQSSQWLNIRRDRPDWIYLQGFGSMNPTAVKKPPRTTIRWIT